MNRTTADWRLGAVKLLHTDVAGRFTARREDNFDICLPLWLTRHHTTIFGALYLGGIVRTVLRWLTMRE